MCRAMTNGNGAWADEAMFEELRAVMSRVEAAPPVVLAAAEAAFGWRTVAIVIAGLEFDSAVDEDDDLARVRGPGTERRLRFRGAGRVVEVSLGNDQGLVGRVEPPLTGAVVLRNADGTTTSAPIDELGHFFFDAVHGGAISLRCAGTDMALGDFETEWVTI